MSVTKGWVQPFASRARRRSPENRSLNDTGIPPLREEEYTNLRHAATKCISGCEICRTVSNSFWRNSLIGPILADDGKNNVAELSGDSADGGEMVLASGTERLVVLREDRVAKGRPGGGQPDGPPEIR